MIKEALYKIATKADKETRKDDKYYCPFCFCSLIKRELRESSYLQDFLRWEEENNTYTVCGSVLLYLEDLGIIKILSGVANRRSGVYCDQLEIKLLSNPDGNKI